MSAAANGANKREDPDKKKDDPNWIHKGKRTATDVQRTKLDKLMKNVEKPAHIPVQRTEKDPNKAAEFVYNVMGSSAGAGSGEFHVYRQIRRKEMLRQKVLTGRKEKDDLNDAYHQKLAENQRLADEKTAKKRAKRQKKKQNSKKRKETKKKESSSESEASETEDGDEEGAEKSVDQTEKKEDNEQDETKADVEEEKKKN